MSLLRRTGGLARRLQLIVPSSKSLEPSDSCNADFLGDGNGIDFSARGFVSASTTAQAPIHIENEPFCRQRNQIVLGTREPMLAPDTWVAPNAILVGDIDLFDQTSIWYGCVLRGDLNHVKVGAFSNIQDRTIIHAARTSPTGLSAATNVGRWVTVGQGCVLRSTTIENCSLIGDRCVLMEGSLVENHSILAPGTVVAPGRLIPSGQLWAGNPARFVRNLTTDEKDEIENVARDMLEYTHKHRLEYQLPDFQYVDSERVREELLQRVIATIKPEMK